MSDQFFVEMRSGKPFEAVTRAIEENSAANSFRVLAVHDVQQTLAEKGLDRDPLKIIEVCNAVFAHGALKKNIDVALFMPCRYSVYTEGSETVVKLNRPTMISEMMPEAGLDELAADVEKTLTKIMQESV